jgi:hypothetical protein
MALLIPSLTGSTNKIKQETGLFARQADQLMQQARPQMQADSLFRSGVISPYPNTRFSQPPFSIALPVGEKYQLAGIFHSNASNFLGGQGGNQQPRR